MRQPRPAPTPDAPTRARFYNRQVLTPADLGQDQAYFQDKHLRQSRLLHGWGIRLGLDPGVMPATMDDKAFREAYRADPAIVPPGDGVWLVVSPGYAVSPAGEELYVSRHAFINATREWPDGTLATAPMDCIPSTGVRVQPRPAGDPLYLVVEGWEADTGAVRAAGACCGDSPAQFEFGRRSDTVQFRLVRKEELKEPFDGTDDPKRLLGSPARRFVCLGAVTFARDATGKPTAKMDGTKAGRRDPMLCPMDCPEPKTVVQRSLLPWVLGLVIALLILLLTIAIIDSRARPTPSKPDAPSSQSTPSVLYYPPEALDLQPRFDTGLYDKLRTFNAPNTVPFYEFGQYKALHVLPAPAGFQLTTDWNAWIHSGTFRSRSRFTLGGEYSVEGSMMADDAYLYIGAHVREPKPNLTDPAVPTDLGNVYTVSSLQVHLRTSDKYPSLTLADTVHFGPGTTDFLHLQMWRNRLGGAMLGIYQHCGPRYTRVVKSDDYAGFVAGDGTPHGYVMAYRIRWSLLGMNRPNNGHRRAMCWDVHFSKPNVTGFGVKLSEFFNPDALQHALRAEPDKPRTSVPDYFMTYTHPELWGEAHFH